MSADFCRQGEARVNKPFFPYASDRSSTSGPAMHPHVDFTPQGHGDAAGDRILLTLLALGLMLLAFFVVLTVRRQIIWDRCGRDLAEC